MPDRVRVRFAPSPTGHLHIGGARTALFNWLFAKHEGGSFVLRIEDTDVERSTTESEVAVLDDLRWLGLYWDEGPDVGGDYGPYRQSERLSIYQERAARLLSEGKAFRCYCTDEELELKRKRALAGGRVPQYDGSCRELTESRRAAMEREGRRPAVRLRGPVRGVAFRDMIRGDVAFDRKMLGDFVILRSDGRPTYNFAVVVDDALMEISHVIRAEEHLPNTMRQVLVYEALGHGLPRFAHVSLVVDRDRSKLSKRRGASSVAELRAQGYLPDAIITYLALLGWSHPDGTELMDREVLIEAFDMSRVSASPAAFDEDKLAWVNAHVLRRAPLEEITNLARTFVRAAGLQVGDAPRFGDMIALAREAVHTLADLPSEMEFFADGDPKIEDDAREWLAGGESRSVLTSIAGELKDASDPMGADEFVSVLKRVGRTLGVSGKSLYMPVRAALTGKTHGPALGSVAAILGPVTLRARLAAAAAATGDKEA
jgi:nondiscriminating glutamyl-tRNA synthetase